MSQHETGELGWEYHRIPASNLLANFLSPEEAVQCLTKNHNGSGLEDSKALVTGSVMS